MTASSAKVLLLGVFLSSSELLPAVSSPSWHATAREPGMARISASSLRLGSTMQEVIAAAEDCSRRAEDRKTDLCSPEVFTNELNSDAKTVIHSFFLDREEVSVESYARCVRALRCEPVTDPRRIAAFTKADVPAVFVRQADAADYCRFRDARLPTEGEFELAARGPARRAFPWGNEFHPLVANAGRTGARVTEKRDGYETLAPTRAFDSGRSPQGVLQLSGNAAEWTSTPFSLHDDKGTNEQSSTFVVKGGSFATAPVHLRGAARRAVPASTRAADIGFRCAKDAYPAGSQSH